MANKVQAKGEENKPSDFLTEQKNDIDALVRKWVEENYGEFREGAETKGALLYRPVIFERCRKFRNAPDGYLKTMLEKSLPDAIKWYFNIFQIIFITGAVSVSTAFFFLSLNNLFAFFTDVNAVSLMEWLIPATLFSLVVVAAVSPHKKSQSPWLSHFVQTKFRIIHNLKEIHIEMYYIAKVLEMREKSKSRATS